MVLRIVIKGDDELDQVMQLKHRYRFRFWYSKYYLASDYWYRLRSEILKRDGYACVKCGASVGLQVDHKTYAHLGFESLDDLQTLCWNCHSLVPSKFDLLAGKNIGKTKMKVSDDTQLYTLLRRGSHGANRISAKIGEDK